MELVRFLVLIIASLVLVLHNSCAHAVHHQGRKLKGNSLVASKENIAPAKMGLVHRDSVSGAFGGNQHQWKYQNGKTSEANTRYSGEKDERSVNTEDAIAREVMNMMRRDYHPRGKTTGRRKPPINNHNHKH
ncbi:hypothetical protein POM88_039650 [Heracleum sosnowskyi]|uniref:Uncharacterized protein n=1 Tax=Heracleum sosnowskyi TaxID=360622 RepID=A0AAD8HBK9_9APIA|nr:hypothetical protein POM88_039650 [Heracleum sosnowskyi]